MVEDVRRARHGARSGPIRRLHDEAVAGSIGDDVVGDGVVPARMDVDAADIVIQHVAVDLDAAGEVVEVDPEADQLAGRVEEGAARRPVPARRPGGGDVRHRVVADDVAR